VTAVRAAFVGLLTLALIAIPAVASAQFRGSASAGLSVSTDTLNPPTNMQVICRGSGQPLTVTWTITTDTYASGYILYGSTLGVEHSVTVPGGRTATSYQPSIVAFPPGTVITMASYYQGWTSARTPGSTVPLNCK
jgi:hypothetical protein